MNSMVKLAMTILVEVQVMTNSMEVKEMTLLMAVQEMITLEIGFMDENILNKINILVE